MDQTQEAERYAIHEAAKLGQVAKVEAFLETNPKLADRVDPDGRRPVHWAVAHQHEPVVNIFCAQSGFDPDVTDGSGWTLLMIACSLKNGKTVVDQMLDKGADPNIRNNSGQTALHLAISKSNVSVVQKLLARGASARTKDVRGQLPLHRAAAIGNLPLIELLHAQGSPLNASDSSGYTALHHAVAEGHAEAAMSLLRAGAAHDRRNEDDQLAINLAPDTRVRRYILQAAEEEDIVLTT